MPRFNPAVDALANLGSSVTRRIDAFGQFWLFALRAALYIPVELTTLRGWRRFLPQCYRIGTRPYR
jgi:ABC-type transporter Mla maintaining outer membrane lipid asymmetry permease subunit MlaE